MAAGCDGRVDASPPCRSDVECSSGRCLEGPDGRGCFESCGDDDECAAGQICTLLADATGQPLPICVARNDSGLARGGACRENADCASRLCIHELCAELCVTCDRGWRCAPDTGTWNGAEVTINTCQWQADWRALELGALATPVEGSMETTFTVPVPVAAFDIVLIDNDNLRVAVKSLIAPDGTVLIDVDDTTNDLNPGFSYPTIATTAVPSTDDPRARPQVGDYRLRVGTYDPADFVNLIPVDGDIDRVAVFFEPEGAEGGLVDLTLLFAPATGLEAATAGADSFIADLLASVQSLLLDPIDCRLATVSFHDLPGTADVIDSGDAIRNLLRTSTYGEPNGVAINVILSSDITFTTGYSAGLPGPPGLYQTPGSGLAVELMSTGIDSGIVVAHEMGHFLGLHHTTELTGGRHDPILDTPECPLGTEISACPDYENLMFPMFPLSTSLTLTPGQIRVLRGSLNLYQADRAVTCPAPTVAYDVTDSQFASGDTRHLTAELAGSCGGAASPERVQLLRLEDPVPTKIELSVVGDDFAPVLYVYQDRCGELQAEVACQSGDAGAMVSLTLEAPPASPHFIVVDGRDGTGGSFVLRVSETP